MVGEVREYDELAGIYEKLDTVRIPTSISDGTHQKVDFGPLDFGTKDGRVLDQVGQERECAWQIMETKIFRLVHFNTVLLHR